jgi:hypothetical protein
LRRFVNSGVVVRILLCAFGVPVWAQINVESLRGVVADPQGGLAVGAQVKVTEAATQVIHTAVTDSQGLYTALSLPAGNYDLSMAMAGFETYTYQALPLASGKNRDLDVKLTVDAVSSHVEVNAAAAPDLETTLMADSGNVGGIATAFSTKSGTSSTHGSVYGFMRKTALDAACDQLRLCRWYGFQPFPYQGNADRPESRSAS